MEGPEPTPSSRVFGPAGQSPRRSALARCAKRFRRAASFPAANFLAFSRPINEGLHAPDVLSTVHRRILLENDTRDMDPVIRVIRRVGREQ